MGPFTSKWPDRSAPAGPSCAHYTSRSLLSQNLTSLSLQETADSPQHGKQPGTIQRQWKSRNAHCHVAALNGKWKSSTQNTDSTTQNMQVGVGVWQWRTHTQDDKMLPWINLPMLLQGLDAIPQTLNCSTPYKVLTTGDYQVGSMKETNAQKPTFQCLEYSTKNDTLTSAPSMPWIHSTTKDSQMPLPFETNQYMKHSLCDYAQWQILMIPKVLNAWIWRASMRSYNPSWLIHNEPSFDRHVQQVWYIQ